MKKIVFVSLLLCVAFGAVAFSTIDAQKSNDEKANINNTIIQSEEAILNIGVIPNSMLNTDKDNEEVLSAEQIQELLSVNSINYNKFFNEKLESIYTEQAEIATAAAEKRAEKMKQPTDTKNEVNTGDLLDITIASGVLNCDVSSVAVNDNSATASAVIIEWCTSIYFDQASGEYHVWLTFSEFDNKYNFVKRNDNWVVDSISGDQLFAPSDYDYDKGTFYSLDEAVTAAEKIVPSEENPF